MQLQTSIRSCEGNHYVLTVIDDSAENSAFLSNNPGAQGLSGVGEVTKETDDIQNGPAVLDSPSLFSRLLSVIVHQLPHNIILCGNTLETLVKQSCNIIQTRQASLSRNSICWSCNFI